MGVAGAEELEQSALQRLLLEGLPEDHEGCLAAHQQVAVRLGLLLQRQRQGERRRQSEIQPAAAARPKAPKEQTPKEQTPKEQTPKEGGPTKQIEDSSLVDAAALWRRLVSRTDELYEVHEHLREAFGTVMRRVVGEVAKGDAEAELLVRDLELAPLKDPVRLHEKAIDEFGGRFADGALPEACVPDVTRCRVVLQTGTQVKDFVVQLIDGVQFDEGFAISNARPADLEAAPAAAQADPLAEGGGLAAASAPVKAAERKVVVVTELQLMSITNRFDQLDPTHFRSIVCALKLTHQGVSCFCEVEVHYCEVLRVAQEKDPAVHYDFFRNRLAGTVPQAELDAILDEKLVFLVDATGIPVLLSLLVLIFTSGGEDLTKLPSNRIELYELGIESAITKRLLPSGHRVSDTLVKEWLRLFNLDRSVAAASSSENKKEQKEREHRKSRKAALSMEHAMQVQDSESAAEKAGAKKQAETSSSTNNKTENKKILSLDEREVPTSCHSLPPIPLLASSCRSLPPRTAPCLLVPLLASSYRSLPPSTAPCLALLLTSDTSLYP